MSAPLAASTLLVPIVTFSFAPRARARSACGTVARVAFGESEPFFSNACRIMPPIFPAPRNATFFPARSLAIIFLGLEQHYGRLNHRGHRVHRGRKPDFLLDSSSISRVHRTLVLDAARLSIQFHAVVTMSLNPRVAFHCNSACAFAGFATSLGGSPARRGTTLRGTGFPVTASTAEITSCTEAPVPVPTLTAKLSFPAARWSSALTCALAKSFTWM